MGLICAPANAPVASRVQSGALGGASLSVFVRHQALYEATTPCPPVVYRSSVRHPAFACCGACVATAAERGKLTHRGLAGLAAEQAGSISLYQRLLSRFSAGARPNQFSRGDSGTVSLAEDEVSSHRIRLRAFIHGMVVPLHPIRIQQWGVSKQGHGQMNRRPN